MMKSITCLILAAATTTLAPSAIAFAPQCAILTRTVMEPPTVGSFPRWESTKLAMADDDDDDVSYHLIHVNYRPSFQHHVLTLKRPSYFLFSTTTGLGTYKIGHGGRSWS
jgi:hypothetical protein